MGGEKLETVQQFKTLLQRELKKWHIGWQKQKGEKEIDFRCCCPSPLPPFPLLALQSASALSQSLLTAGPPVGEAIRFLQQRLSFVWGYKIARREVSLPLFF